MKYRDLPAVEDIARDEMTRVVGGLTWGEAVANRIALEGVGRAFWLGVIFGEQETGTTNVGQLIQARSEENALPGNNGVKIRVDANLPPGLV